MADITFQERVLMAAGAICMGCGLGLLMVENPRFRETSRSSDKTSFDNFDELRQHLTRTEYHKAYVAIEGTVVKLENNVILSEKAQAVEGAVKQITTYGVSMLRLFREWDYALSVYNFMRSDRCEHTDCTSVPFSLNDSSGHSLKVFNMHCADGVHQVMEEVWSEPVRTNSRTLDGLTACERLLKFGTHLGAYGDAVLQGNEIAFFPMIVSPSMKWMTLRYHLCSSAGVVLIVIGFFLFLKVGREQFMRQC